MIIWTSISCPTVICSPVCYFSRENPVVKPTALGSIFSSYTFISILLFAFLFICNFYFQIYIIKKPKIPHWILFALICISQFITTFSRPRANFSRRYPKGIDNPFYMWVASICYLCAGAVHVVLRGSPTGSITLVSSLREIPIIVMLHHPILFGEIPT